jgi:peptidoglycan-N-acetylglucosamine deacetylase
VSELRVALTFDAEHPDRAHCPPGVQERVLEILAGAGVRATFFLQGRWTSAYPSTARRIAEAGHLVGNHSDHHAHVTEFSDEGLRADVSEAEEVIREVTGADPRPWFRCPFGDGNDDERVLRLLDGLGYRNVHWDIEGFDWEGERSADDVAREVLDGVSSHGDGAVVLLHTWPETTPPSVERIVDGLRDRGATFVTVDEVLG